ncbi:hypothetical protein D3C84_597530 [compost metagenome]
MRALAEQAEGHVHAGHGGAQFVGGTQDELAAHPLESTLFSHIVQHHHRAENLPLGMNDRREAICQQPRFTINLDIQVIRHPLQCAAT